MSDKLSNSEIENIKQYVEDRKLAKLLQELYNELQLDEKYKSAQQILDDRELAKIIAQKEKDELAMRAQIEKDKELAQIEADKKFAEIIAQKEKAELLA